MKPPHSMPIVVPRDLPREWGCCVRRSTFPGEHWWLAVIWHDYHAWFRFFATYAPSLDDLRTDLVAHPDLWRRVTSA